MKKIALCLLFLALMSACGSCAGRQYPHQAPTMMDVAVVKITSINAKGEEVGYCTAWKLDENRMVTAGHCCVYDETPADADPLLILMGAVETVEKDVPMFTMEGPHAIPGAVAKPIHRDADHDICILQGKMNGAPIALAKHDPPIGERVWTAGYPHTTYLISEGIWSGREDGQGVASTSVWGGASGSPVMDTDGRAVGVLVAYYRPFSTLSFIAPVEWLQINAAVTANVLPK